MDDLKVTSFLTYFNADPEDYDSRQLRRATRNTESRKSRQSLRFSEELGFDGQRPDLFPRRLVAHIKYKLPALHDLLMRNI